MLPFEYRAFDKKTHQMIYGFTPHERIFSYRDKFVEILLHHAW